MINIEALAASSGVSFVVGAADRSKPTSLMTAITSGWTRGPGSVPAEMARALVGSASALNQAAAICERPALCTHANSTVVIEPASVTSGTLSRDGSSAAGVSQRSRSAADIPPSTCATTNPGTSPGRMPAKVSVNARAIVTAGLANEVDAVNQ